MELATFKFGVGIWRTITTKRKKKLQKTSTCEIIFVNKTIKTN